MERGVCLPRRDRHARKQLGPNSDYRSNPCRGTCRLRAGTAPIVLLPRSLLHATRATAQAILAFAALFVASAQVATLRAQSPWADDPYDAISSYAAIALPLI